MDRIELLDRIVDFRREEVRGRDGVRIDLRPRAFVVLRRLAAADGALVTKDELLSECWRGVIVTEDSLTQCISEIRRALGEGGRDLIRTVPRRGYALLPPLAVAPAQISALALQHPSPASSTLAPLVSASLPLAVHLPAALHSQDLGDTACFGPPSFSPDKLSVAVMPFESLTNDPAGDYFADGVVEDIIAALSRIRWFRVVARGTSFAYKGRSASPAQLGRELGVRYVLNGSMRQSGTRFRVTTALVDTDTETPIWTERFDGVVDDIFDVQDAITAKVAAAIEPRLIDVEADRARRQRPANPTAYDCFLRGLAQFYSDTQESIAATLHLLHKAISADPAYAPPYALAAECLVYRIDYGWSPDREVDRSEAARLADAALERDQDDPTVLVLSAHVLSYARHDRVTPLALLERALAINPNLPIAFQLGGWVQLYVGDATAAVEWFSRGRQLSPLDTRNFIYYSGLAFALIVLGRENEALAWAQKSVVTKPSWSAGWRVLTSALMHLGRPSDAKSAAARVREIAPQYRIRITRELYPSLPGLEHYLDGLRHAGIPE